MSRRKNTTLRAGLMCGASAWTGSRRVRLDKTLGEVYQINIKIQNQYTERMGGCKDGRE